MCCSAVWIISFLGPDAEIRDANVLANSCDRELPSPAVNQNEIKGFERCGAHEPTFTPCGVCTSACDPIIVPGAILSKRGLRRNERVLLVVGILRDRKLLGIPHLPRALIAARGVIRAAQQDKPRETLKKVPCGRNSSLGTGRRPRSNHGDGPEKGAQRERKDQGIVRIHSTAINGRGRIRGLCLFTARL